jgi:DNA-directed RNA polymerase subunit RPC12/RpoP
MAYDIEDKYLYEILDDYKDCQIEKDKDEIIKAFMKLIWSCKNKRNTYLKDIRFSVSRSLLETEIGKIFNTYSDISYIAYKSMTKETDFVSLIRQKINNIYTNLCDGDVCLKKEYMDLIKSPKKMYYRWKDGEEYNPKTLTAEIEEIMEKSIAVKEKYNKQKLNITWNEYKKIIVPYFKRMFNNFIPLEKYEDKSKITLDIDTWSEDNFVIAYLCKGLDGYMRNYQKEYYNLPSHGNYKRCVDCGDLYISKDKAYRQIRCNKCKKKYDRILRMKNYYKNKM